MTEPVYYLSKELWRFSEGNRKNVILYVTLRFFASAVDALRPLLLAWVLNEIQQGSPQPSRLLALISLFIVLTIAFWAFHGPSRTIERNNAFYVRAKYRQHLVDGIMNLPSSWHTNHQSGDTLDKVDKATKGLYSYAEYSFLVLDAILKLLFALIAFAYFNIQAIPAALILIAAGIVTILLFDRKLKRNYKKLNNAENAISAKVYDAISNINTVIILRLAPLFSRDIRKYIERPKETDQQTNRLDEIKWFTVSMFTATMTVAILGIYIFSVEVIMVGTLVALYEYIKRINDVFFRFASRYGQIVREKTWVENVHPISTLFRPDKHITKLDKHNWNDLTISLSSFAYEESPVLEDIEVTLRSGERVALVGASGSGKTTFLQVLRGLYDSQARLQVDGKQEMFSSLQHHITLIPQEPEMFTGTIRENITLGVSHPNRAVERAVELAKFTEVIDTLPKGYDSHITERGVNLSGGQKQRLALARGLLAAQRKEILLLDEPTSSVDSANERAIYESIFKEYADKTIVSTLHRLHLLPLFDTIYLFDKGQIIGVGTYDELLRESEAFGTLWEKYQS